MTIQTRTCVFESAHFEIVLDFKLVDDSGRFSVVFSVRSHSPQSVAAMLRVQTVWQSWVSSIVDGVFLPLPKGWRVKDGAQEVAPSGTPDHLH